MSQTFCPECGFDVPIDGDGCCNSCGATATGKAIDSLIRAINLHGDELEKAHKRIAELEAENVRLRCDAVDDKKLISFERSIVAGVQAKMMELGAENAALREFAKHLESRMEEKNKLIVDLHAELAALRSANAWRPASEPPEHECKIVIKTRGIVTTGWFDLETRNYWILKERDLPKSRHYRNEMMMDSEIDGWRELPTPEGE